MRSAVTWCERSEQTSDLGISMTFDAKGSNLEHLGAPAILDARGSDVEVLFIDRHDNYMRDCMYAADRWDLIVPGPLSSYPVVHDPNGIDDDDDNDLTTNCGQTSDGAEEAFGEEFGRVGTNVAAVTFEFADAEPVHATLWHGFYEAWWNWPDEPNGVTLRTKSGKFLNPEIVDAPSPGPQPPSPPVPQPC
jgi:hypothetical protein